MMNALHADNLTFTPETALVDRELRARIRAEYCEMRGLRLTLPQAACLFGLGQDQCGQVLGELVAEGVLGRHGDEYAAGVGCCRS